MRTTILFFNHAEGKSFKPDSIITYLNFRTLKDAKEWAKSHRISFWLTSHGYEDCKCYGFYRTFMLLPLGLRR